MNQSVAELIQDYKTKVSNDWTLCKEGCFDEDIYRKHCSILYHDFYKEIKKMDKKIIIDQILLHLDNLSSETDWDSEHYLWIDCITEVPDRVFIPYLVKILKMQGDKVLYFPVLWVIKGLPEEIGEEAVPGICEAISANNPFWTEYVFAEAFEALIFNLNDMAEEFIYKSCSSDVPFIKKWATYYRDNWLENVEDDE